MVMGSIASPLACLLDLHGCRRAGPLRRKRGVIAPRNHFVPGGAFLGGFGAPGGTICGLVSRFGSG